MEIKVRDLIQDIYIYLKMRNGITSAGEDM